MCSLDNGPNGIGKMFAVEHVDVEPVPVIYQMDPLQRHLRTPMHRDIRPVRLQVSDTGNISDTCA